jgi:hypothetical protein
MSAGSCLPSQLRAGHPPGRGGARGSRGPAGRLRMPRRRPGPAARVVSGRPGTWLQQADETTFDAVRALRDRVLRLLGSAPEVSDVGLIAGCKGGGRFDAHLDPTGPRSRSGSTCSRTRGDGPTFIRRPGPAGSARPGPPAGCPAESRPDGPGRPTPVPGGRQAGGQRDAPSLAPGRPTPERRGGPIPGTGGAASRNRWAGDVSREPRRTGPAGCRRLRMRQERSPRGTTGSPPSFKAD